MLPEITPTTDGSFTLLNRALNVTYHSRHGALQESRHIFIEQGLKYAVEQRGKALSLFEIGFGTGLNALLTLSESQTNNLSINYQAIEKYPVPSSLAQQLNYPELIDPSLKSVFTSMHEAQWDKALQLASNFRLTKYKADLDHFMFPDQLHLVYYDAFAPGVSSEMWSKPVMEALYDQMLPDACLVTFCAKGDIKRLLKHCGFKVQTLPGPPGKREMTRAVK